MHGIQSKNQETIKTEKRVPYFREFSDSGFMYFFLIPQLSRTSANAKTNQSQVVTYEIELAPRKVSF